VDTRRKIMSSEEGTASLLRFVLSEQSIEVVLGRFDPLLARHARRLAQLAERGNRLAVGIITAPGDILPGRARAELVAALASVTRVTEVPSTEVASLLSGIPQGQIFREEDCHNEWRLELIRQVRSRYGK
jgi:hypothetical protein